MKIKTPGKKHKVMWRWQWRWIKNGETNHFGPIVIRTVKRHPQIGYKR